MQTSFFKTSRGKSSTEPTTREPTHLYQAKPSLETYFIVIGSSYQLQSTRMDTSVPCSNILYMELSLHQSHPVNNSSLIDQMPRQCTNEQHLSRHPAEYFWKQTITGNTPSGRNQPHRFFGRSYMAPTPSITTIQQIGIGIAHAYSSLLLKATQNFKISDATPGFDIFNFLLPRDQIDVIPNLDVDVN